MEKLTRGHKTEVKRARVDDGSGSRCGGYQCGEDSGGGYRGGGGGSEKDCTKARYHDKNRSYEEQRNYKSVKKMEPLLD